MKPTNPRDLKPGKTMWLGGGLFARMTKAREIRYGCQYTLPDGTSKREMIGTKTDAKKLLKARRGQVVEGRYKKKIVAPTLRELYTRYESYQRSEFTSERSLKALDAVLSRLPDMKADKLTTERIQQYKEERGTETSRKSGRPISKVTINREINALKGMLSKAVEWKLLAENPAAGMKDTKTQQGEMKGYEFTREEEATLVKVAAPHLRPLIIVGIHTGMRVDDELIRLQWEPGPEGSDWPYIDGDNGEIVVRRSKGKRVRRLPMNPHVLAALKSIKGRREGPVFLHDRQTFKRFPRRAWKATVKLAVAALEPDKVKQAKHPLTPCRPHDMRHTYCTRLGLLIGDNFGPADWLELTGHKNLATLQRYVHSKRERRQWAVDHISEWVQEKASAAVRSI
jgi:integrase